MISCVKGKQLQIKDFEDYELGDGGAKKNNYFCFKFFQELSLS